MSLPAQSQLPEPPVNMAEAEEPITLGGRIGISLLVFFVLAITTIGLGKFIALLLR
jgi:hypothetical protein